MGHRWLTVAMASALAWGAVGCGSGEPSGGEQGQAAVTASSATSGGCTLADAGGLPSILALVPDTAANREYTTVSDLRAFLDDQGKELPGDFREIEWVDPVNLFNPPTLLRQAIGQADEDPDPLAAEFGMELGEVDQGVTAGMPPEAIELLIGTFDPAKVDEVVGSDEIWSPQEEMVEAYGETYYAWGDDGEVQMEGRSPIRDLGIGGRLWVDEGVAAFTRSTPPMDAFLAACTGTEPNLVDDADYGGIAQRLDDFEGAFNVTFTDQVRAPGDIEGLEPRGTEGTVVDDSVPLEGVAAYGFASGPSDDPELARIRLVLASGSEAQATANEEHLADRIESGSSATGGRPWSDVLSIESIEVDGSFVIVELLAKNTQVLTNELLKRDSLVVSEG